MTMLSPLFLPICQDSVTGENTWKLVKSGSKCDMRKYAFTQSQRIINITLLLRQLHWLRALKRIQFKLDVLVYKCLHGTAPS